MESKLIEIKAAIVAAASVLGIFLGWKGILCVVWLSAMILDYISGSAAALRNGEWSSAVAREGLWHKGGMILVVIVAAIADMVMSMLFREAPDIGITWPGAVYPTVLAWYIITEIGSVLENATKMGAPVPSWLGKLLAVTFKRVDEGKESV